MAAVSVQDRARLGTRMLTCLSTAFTACSEGFPASAHKATDADHVKAPLCELLQHTLTLGWELDLPDIHISHIAPSHF